MSTSTDPVRQRMAAANPARTEAELPGEVMSAAVLLAMIDDRSGAMTHKADSQGQGNPVTTRGVRRNWAAAFAASFVVVLVIGLTFGMLSRGGDPSDVVAPVTTSPTAALAAGDGQTVSVTVSDVSGRAGDELAGVLYEGGELTDLDRDAVGGFRTVVEGDDFTTTEVVREPGEVGVGRFPFVSDEALTVEPGTYTLVLWVDEGLNPVSRWVPINSYTDGDVLIEGTDLFACHMVFEVGDDAQTDVAVEAGLHHNGWNVDCATGVAIPGTDTAAAVAQGDMWMPDLPMSMPPVSGVGDGQTVSVTVSDVSGRAGDELAGVLYEGGEFTDPSDDAVGGFWTVIEGDDFTTTEVVREPGEVGVGRFPFVSDEALTVEPGTYTLVLWVDTGLGGMKRWVPINTDGMGLFGCHMVFDVRDDAQTDVVVEANLEPDGWNVDCATGVAIPGTDAAAAVAPGDMWMPDLPMSMPPVSGVGDGQTVSVTVSEVLGHDGQELAAVLYEGGELTDLDRDAVGGFWTVIEGDEFTTTEVVREPGEVGVGRFPFVSDEALTVDPGMYTLVVWVDYGLNPVNRWVPINTDGMGLFGCQVVFDVRDDAQTDVAVVANLQPDGWNADCTIP